jgi:hypothetical protein
VHGSEKSQDRGRPLETPVRSILDWRPDTEKVAAALGQAQGWLGKDSPKGPR